MKFAKTLGELKESGYRSHSTKDELRENLINLIKSGQKRFPGIIGYDRTVLPQLENAILSRHDLLLLGLRGQAKTRILRQLVSLLDEHLPIIKGSQLNEDPFNPISDKHKMLAAEAGDELEIDWIHRDLRYNEKLATPDVTVADLIGDLDPIKAVREKLDISNEEVIHWGIIPRTNRGIFAINELPDLQPRIQVALLNILEENDLQIRGFPIRIPLDMMLAFTANPEDYTNRGNIITPLKDRIASQVNTHYPRDLKDARQITEQEAWKERGIKIKIPTLIKDILEEIAFRARESEYVDQTSGVSARLTISAYENLLSNVERRVVLNNDRHAQARIADLYAVLPSIMGKIELVYEGEQEGPSMVAVNLVGEAIKKTFLSMFPEPRRERKRTPEGEYEEIIPEDSVYEPVIDFFSAGKQLEISDEMPYSEYKEALLDIVGLREIVLKYCDIKDEDEIFAYMEFVLEGLHQMNRIAKESPDNKFIYTDMIQRILRS
ncbi:MAG: magnesium chelatase [candidate division Zixibacteria bacterium]|nr:magnesium chelatase [candidate division Zixibacteria bacterium]NIR66729.1 magnesium chelatase [candidate division Zixibacteria bacterium]NIS14977.1 magnesium chelatase [candidate division Zixibacteria bacterium]NIS48264.1 magnesium chelatase [candidate division Zixibacteria bacterium]NIT51503.1 magnesium chelatase [candidate division Zixibacteria bacterium]